LGFFKNILLFLYHKMLKIGDVDGFLSPVTTSPASVPAAAVMTAPPSAIPALID